MSSNFFDKWPKKLLEEYGKLQLPSLWDYLNVQEQQAHAVREIEKKLGPINQSLKQIDEKMKIFEEGVELEIPIYDPLPPGTLPGSISENLPSHQSYDSEITGEKSYPAWEVDMMKQATQLEQRQWEEAYIAMYETVSQLLIDQQTLYTEILSLFSITQRTRKKEKLPIKHFVLDRINKTESYRRQLQSHLFDHGIEVISPEKGELYNEKLHRVIMPHNSDVNKLQGKKSKKAHVKELIHCGYLRSSTIIRRADVTVVIS